MNFADKDGTTKVYIPVHPCPVLNVLMYPGGFQNMGHGQVQNADVSDISDFFSNFYKSDFSIITDSQMRKLEF